MKAPRINEVWLAKPKDETRYYFLVTDVYKKKEDDYKISDDDWNEAKVGTKFVYGINERVGITTTHRAPLKDFLEHYQYYTKARICSCHHCNKVHFPSNLVT